MPHFTRGAGEHYLPLPNARLVDPHASGGPSDVVVVAPAGTPVHAVCAGTVRDGDGDTLRIEGDDGHTCLYATVQDQRVRPGEQVDAGAIVGVIGTDGDRHMLRLSVVDRHNVPVRSHVLLLGAADPNELGYGPSGTGMDVDPDASPVAARVRTGPAPVVRPSTSVASKRQSPRTASPPTRSVPSRPVPAPDRRPEPVARAADDREQVSSVDDQPVDTATAAPQAGGQVGAVDDQRPPPGVRQAPPVPPPGVRQAPPVPPPGVRQAPPVPPPIPSAKQEDDTDEEPSTPPSARSKEQQRTRAAMLIAGRKRRPDGPKQ